MNETIHFSELEKISKEKEQENKVFVEMLKAGRHNIDESVHRFANHYESIIDCTACGNCCSKLHPGVSEEDIPALAKAWGKNEDGVKEEILVRDHDAGAWYMKKSPCVFLNGKKCSVYSLRPASCADFPHLKQPYSRLRLKRIMANYEVCPIVYHVIEDLKKEFKAQDNSGIASE